MSLLQRLDDCVKFGILTSSSWKLERGVHCVCCDRQRSKRDEMISIPCVSFFSAGPASEIRINEKEIFPFFSVLLLLLPFSVWNELQLLSPPLPAIFCRIYISRMIACGLWHANSHYFTFFKQNWTNIERKSRI